MSGHRHLISLLEKKGHSARSLDCIAKKLSYEDSLKYINEFSPSLIVISSILTPQDSIKYAKFLVNNWVKAHLITFGETTLNHKYILKKAHCIDFVIMGEPENTLLDIADYYEGKIKIGDINGTAYLHNAEVVENKLRHAIDNLDELGMPILKFPEDDTNKRYYILSSKGCYGNCTFCRTQSYNQLNPGKKWRYKSPGAVVDEMESVHKVNKGAVFYFYDQEFMGGGIPEGKDRAYKIAEEILKRNLKLRFSFLCRPDDVELNLFKHLKTTGLSSVFIGIESGSQKVLDRFRKGITVAVNENAIYTLNELKIPFQAGWLMYHPKAVLSEIKENLQFIRRTRLYMSIWFYVAIFNDVRLYYKTPLFWEFAKNDGKSFESLYDTFEYPFNYSDPSMNMLLIGLFTFHHLVKQYMGLLTFCLNRSHLIVKKKTRFIEWIDYVDKMTSFEQNLGLLVLESFEKAVHIIDERQRTISNSFYSSVQESVGKDIDKEVVQDFYNYAQKHFKKDAQSMFDEILDFLLSLEIIKSGELAAFTQNLKENI